MNARSLSLLLLVAPLAAWAQSPQVCPWLTAGTAAKILGGDVQVTAKIDSNGSGSCSFATAATPAHSIEIRVGKTDSHACGPKSAPLTAIGNQAVQCSSFDSGGRQVWTVSGRVRDAWFVVTLAGPSPQGEPEQSPNESTASSAIGFLAEQVAGNLY